MSQHYLNKLFEPLSVVVFGASERENSVGGIVFRNMLRAGFTGDVFPVNPKHTEVHGRKCYSDLEQISHTVDLAVITTPAATVPQILESCGRNGVKAAIILSAGFREAGDNGKRLEKAVLEIARRYGIRFIGPNCLGVIRPSVGLDTTFNKGDVASGNLALVSQSGALCTAIIDWASVNDVGFSSIVSMGVSADIDFGEVLDYLIADPKTSSILLYIEGIQDARSFMSGLRAAARVKPIIVVKAGRHQAGSKAALSHTGALVGADDVFDAALRRAGVVRGTHIGDLFAAATVLAEGLRARGERLVIITNGGGPSAMACDRASDLGIPLAELSKESLDQLNAILPPMWSHANPVDVLGDASPERYRQAIDICLRDDSVDGALVLLTPQAMTAPDAVAEQVIQAATQSNKPLITCWMGDRQVSTARKQFVDANVPTFRLPETAIQGFSYLTSFYKNQKLLLQTPGPIVRRHKQPDIEGAKLIIKNALAEKRNVLTEVESKAILSIFQIPVSQTAIARTAEEALVQAEAMGLPVAMKIYSKRITHKSDIGGVRLGLSNASAVQNAFYELINIVKAQLPDIEPEGVVVEPMHHASHGRELLVGLISDPIFGPVITFGSGGTAVEFLQDRAVALPPLNTLLAKDLISRTRAAKFLKPFRGMPAADESVVEDILLRLSEMACELPWIQELDINPLIVDEHGAMAVDARIVVKHHAELLGRYEHMAIHPYPSRLVSEHQLPGGVSLTVRPIRPEDAEIEAVFIRNLSERSKYNRFMHDLRELTPEMLVRFTQIDYDREMAFVALIGDAGVDTEIGVCRFVTNIDGKSCEFAIVIADEWQQKGIAHILMEKLIEWARYRNLETMQGDVLVSNKEMQALARSLGFSVTPNSEDAGLMKLLMQL